MSTGTASDSDREDIGERVGPSVEALQQQQRGTSSSSFVVHTKAATAKSLRGAS
jgi:hypothetical protein